ncbi:MAG: hypothetical protein HY327_12480 [Chloroflexi bacterium]|nr:hypothetical protein [Chloroflexota bacterium]
MVEQVFAAILAGFALLIIQYKTGWFTEKGRSSFMDSISARIGGLSKSTQKTLDQAREMIGKYMPIIFLGENFFSLMLQPRNSLLLFLGHYLASFWIAGFVMNTMDPPIGFMVGVLILLSVIVRLSVFIPSGISSTALWGENLAFPDLNDPKTLFFLIITLIIFAIWLCVRAILTYIQEAHRQSEGAILFLQESPQISGLIRATEQKMLTDILRQWTKCQDEIGTRNRSVANPLSRCVPLEFDKYHLVLGMLAQDLTHYLSLKNFRRRRYSLTPRGTSIESELRMFLHIPYLTISFQAISSDKYKSVRNAVEQIDKTEQLPNT